MPIRKAAWGAATSKAGRLGPALPRRHRGPCGHATSRVGEQERRYPSCLFPPSTRRGRKGDSHENAACTRPPLKASRPVLPPMSMGQNRAGTKSGGSGATHLTGGGFAARMNNRDVGRPGRPSPSLPPAIASGAAGSPKGRASSEPLESVAGRSRGGRSAVFETWCWLSVSSGIARL